MRHSYQETRPFSIASIVSGLGAVWGAGIFGKAGIEGAGGVGIKAPLVIEDARTNATVGEVTEGLAKLASRINRSMTLFSLLATLLFDMQAFVDLPGILSTISKKLDSSTWQGTASGQVMVSRYASGQTKRP